MANEGNLRKLSTREAREIGKIGGQASGEVRREKAMLKDMLEEALNKKSSGKNSATKREKIVNNLIAIASSKNKQAVKAFEVIRDTIGEKPIQKVDMEVSGSEAQAELQEYLQELKNAKG